VMVHQVPDPVFTTVKGLIRIMNEPEWRKELIFSLKDFVGNLI